ncbi:hypothetical protein [Lactiplantibacillus pentosus]|uniref:hypothetical protein n=1 Tax=Lactiplantibacillus pentosus TaxID=1589 RepID=UPI001C200DCA|nr:hypothetical protein [Lactiplantibacillus pentosus]MBU7504179.1 hypothetical protein [Lactiplantibacillus pentosus]MDY1545065.1 hypothetical protein [Lactiplantibacillus pentosus]
MGAIIKNGTIKSNLFHKNFEFKMSIIVGINNTIIKKKAAINSQIILVPTALIFDGEAEILLLYSDILSAMNVTKAVTNPDPSIIDMMCHNCSVVILNQLLTFSIPRYCYILGNVSGRS